MTTAVLPTVPVTLSDPFERALAWRAGSLWSRTSQVTLVALLLWFSGQRDMVVVWAVTTWICGLVDACLSRRLLHRRRTPGAIAVVCASYMMSAGTFAASALLLAMPPTPMHLAEAVLVLCAACLHNAMMCCGSRLATAVLVAPGSIILITGAVLARQIGYQVATADILLMAVASVVFTIFIVRLASAFYARGQTLKSALDGLSYAGRAAQEGRQRWRMIFHHSPMAHRCVDASSLYRLLHAEGGPTASGLGNRLKAMVNSVDDIAPHIRVLEANEAAEAMFGGRAARPRFTEASLEAFFEALNGVGEDGVLPMFLAQIVRTDGEIIEVEIHHRVAPGPGAPWSLCLATYVDVTDARRAAREQLEALKAAEVANRAKSDFLTVISHEIRTPLNGVLGMAQAMALNPLSRLQRQRLRVISESGSALLAIVDDLLDLSKIEAGGLEIVRADCDLSALVESVHAAYSAGAAARGLSFVLDLDPAASGVYGADAGRLRQILGNLISNAIKFTHEGEVAVRLARTDRGVRLEVSDTGIGIALDRIAALFETFVQGDSSPTRRYGGAGLGLAICRQLAQAMGGDISACSMPGRGSAFTVDLPMILSRTGAGVAAGRPASGGPLRVLAAEDNPVNRMVLKALLAQLDIEPAFVENGLEAVEAWEAADWDVILMDVQMPEMDGPAATRRIRAREAELGRAQTPIIAVTANAMIHQVASYRAAGMTEVISKPINVEALFSALLSAVAAPPVQPPMAATG
ncbi:ATP-binding protein [Phenylobacterium sp.]|jgi:signal transduction histidine kinase/ActR/RegA family two-component response regulator|uniref:ATP-binding protein n=1 Tax=Phenylobacterium sp. TaxID=1871053 RepID=UPI002E35228F|nr:ATP-binding protein [Phenylobacterium sp.]HEX3367479.1 ATP-binding protein [Phenylobacterium sp.]